MKLSRLLTALGITAVVSLLALAPAIAQTGDSSPETEAEVIATEVYIYGYPLVTMEMTRRVMTNTEKAEGDKAPMGQFAHLRLFPDASFRDVTAPNADTLYSSAWLNVGNQPYILHVPSQSGRYFLMPMLSGWTDVFGQPGTRTTGTHANDFAITGPKWNGKLPKGVKEFKSPTNLVWIIGRTYSSATPEDYEAVHEIQDQYTLTPLDSFGKVYTPPSGTFDPKIDTRTPVRDQVNAMDAGTFFKTLAELMKTNPPSTEDRAIVAQMAKIGLVPGKDFEPSMIAGLENVPSRAQAKIEDHEYRSGKDTNGWTYPVKTGRYDTDYLQRAYVAYKGLGANLPEDAIYPFADTESEGQPLVGTNQYVIHFDKGKTPPAKGFWSITMYDDQNFFVDNSLNRYSISPRDHLKFNEDGSLDVYIQHEEPKGTKQANWLPAPEGKFTLMLRIYWPRPAVLNGSWQPPTITKVSE